MRIVQVRIRTWWRIPQHTSEDPDCFNFDYVSPDATRLKDILTGFKNPCPNICTPPPPSSYLALPHFVEDTKEMTIVHLDIFWSTHIVVVRQTQYCGIVDEDALRRKKSLI
jgi:hypothetical protein